MVRHLILRPSVQGTPFFLVLLVLLSSWGTLQAATPHFQGQLLQFTAAGHVLGFHPDGVYVASGDHMLHIGFDGGAGVEPEAVVGTGKNRGKTQSLTRVTYTDLWPGISLNYEAAARSIALSTWEINAGADADQIRLRYNAPAAIEKNGSLSINYETGTMRESAPIAWQQIDGHRHPVEIAFHLLDTSESSSVISFKVGRFNHAYPLLIDPVITWNTFMGSSSIDNGLAIAVDGNGNVYVAGRSNASWGLPKNAHAGGIDAFAAKFNNNGQRIWNTFMGSSSNDYAWDIAVDDKGNVYVAGDSLATWGSPVNKYSDNSDAFATKLNSSGQRIWNTFMGSSAIEYGRSIALDGGGNVYVTGYSGASWGDVPVIDHSSHGFDAFSAKLNNSGDRIWHTFMGGFEDCHGRDIAVDGNGNIYVAGDSASSWGSPVSPHSGRGSLDAFATKLNNDGARLWNTFIGSGGVDFGRAIAVDSTANVYVAGTSLYSWGAPKNPHSGSYYFDAFGVKLSANGTRLWNTFMGSLGNDSGFDIAVDSDRNVYVAGKSEATWGSPEDLENKYKGGSDAFVAKLNNFGIRIWNSFMGSWDHDSGNAFAIGNNGNGYIAGRSNAVWGSPVNTYVGGIDAFVAKLDLNAEYCTFFTIKPKNGNTVEVCL